MRLPQDKILHIDTEFENGKVNVVAEWQGELVRCKDCEYKRLYDEGETKYYYCALEDRPNRNWSVDDTDYCSWAEKSEVEK